MQPEEIISDFILSHPIAPSERKIGVEIECILFNRDGSRLPVNPGRGYSAMDMLGELETLQDQDQPKSWYSLEPGGQVEWASPPEPSLWEIDRHFRRHLKRMATLCERQELVVLDLSLDPIHHPDQVDLIRLPKYEIMDKRFAITGTRGTWMMRNSTSVQVNLDFSTPEEAGEMAFLADALSPLASLLFAHAPFVGGRPAGRSNSRAIVWMRTDPARCGSLLSQGIDRLPDFLPSYVRWSGRVPLLFTQDQTGDFHPSRLSGREWIEELPDDTSRRKAVWWILHQIFTHVRFKNVLEIRGSDRPPFGYEFAPSAWWLGLLWEESVRQELIHRVERWSTEERRLLEQTTLEVDWSQPGPEDRTVREWLDWLSDLALEGLRQRGNRLPKDETPFLRPYLDRVLSQGPPALTVQDRFMRSGMDLPAYILKTYQNREWIS
ncbi:MAG: hypothetical protein D6762_03645 [Candidatus Neomarinimicrobiota bacterium]|nr:MAG: hypothetical protein D6762_03645 [Candidatus Neomarinimicrobiota bacterium]